MAEEAGATNVSHGPALAGQEVDKKPEQPADTAAATTKEVVLAKAVRRRAARIAKMDNPGKKKQATAKFLKSVMTAIADGSAKSPRSCAVAALAAYEAADAST